MNFLNKDPKLISNCQICYREFSILAIRHRCKRCYRVICSDCGKARIKIMVYDENKVHKVCPPCDKENKFQTEFIAINQPGWGKLSNVGKKWMQACQPKKNTASSQSESYAHYLALAKHPTTKFDDFAVIDRDVMGGRSKRTTFNYSMQEFLFHSQKSLEEDKIKEMITNVLKAYCMKFPTLGYTQGMSYITVFLLSLMDEESAFWMLGYIVTHLLPDNFYASSRQGVPLMGYQQEKFVVWELTKEALKMDENTADKVQTFLEINGPALLVPLLVNYLTFEILYETWNQMIMTRSFTVFRKVVIKLVQVLIPEIKKKALINPPDAQGRLTRRFNRDEFKQAQKIEINEAQVKDLEEKFRKEYSSQWMTNQTHIYHTLQKITHFSKKEIMELQAEFNKYLQAPQAAEGEESFGVVPENVGIRKEDFKKIMTEVVAKDEERKEFIKAFDLDQMFKVFDVDNSEVIDFKEFLISLSLLMRGSLEERAEFAFHVFDVGGKGHLTAKEFHEYLNSIVQAAVISNQGNLTPFFKDDLKKFEDTMMEIIKEKDNIAFMDVKNDLLLHEMLQYCDMSEELRIRGETIAKITNTLHSNPFEPKSPLLTSVISAGTFENGSLLSSRVLQSSASRSIPEMGSSSISGRPQSISKEVEDTNARTTFDTGSYQGGSPLASSEIKKHETPVEVPIETEVETVEVKQYEEVKEAQVVEVIEVVETVEVVERVEEVKEVQVVQEVEEVVQFKAFKEFNEPKEEPEKVVEIVEDKQVQEIKLLKDIRESPAPNDKIVINDQFLALYAHMADTNDEKLIEMRKENMTKEAGKSNENCQVCNMF